MVASRGPRLPDRGGSFRRIKVGNAVRWLVVLVLLGSMLAVAWDEIRFRAAPQEWAVVRIAVVGSGSGEEAADGRAFQQGAELYARQLLRDRSRPLRVELQFFDDGNEAEQAAQRYVTHVLGARQVALIGENLTYGRGVAEGFEQRCALDPDCSIAARWSFDKAALSQRDLQLELHGIAAELVKALRRRGFEGAFIAPNTLASRPFIEAFGAHELRWTQGVYPIAPLVMDGAEPPSRPSAPPTSGPTARSPAGARPWPTTPRRSSSEPPSWESSPATRPTSRATARRSGTASPA